MNNLIRPVVACGLAVTAVVCAVGVASADPKPPAEPAVITVSVSPTAVAAGGQADVTVHLAPKDGIKINRYPKIKLAVSETAGLNRESLVEVGNDTPPPPGSLEHNYYKTVDPVELRLTVDEHAPKGRHELSGKLTYFYCMAASGFCAPKHVPVTIPIEVR